MKEWSPLDMLQLTGVILGFSMTAPMFFASKRASRYE
jgi:hypothetical protein